MVDLQGIERKEEFLLTDPSINCQEPRFGSTNLGAEGMKAFYRTHKCNEVCKEMDLKENASMLKKIKNFCGYY